MGIKRLKYHNVLKNFCVYLTFLEIFTLPWSGNILNRAPTSKIRLFKHFSRAYFPWMAVIDSTAKTTWKALHLPDGGAKKINISPLFCLATPSNYSQSLSELFALKQGIDRLKQTHFSFGQSWLIFWTNFG